MTQLIDSAFTQMSVERMRRIRPAYRKVQRVIASCNTTGQLITAYNMVLNFQGMFPYADKFSVKLCETLYSHKCGDDLMKLIQDGRA